MTTAGNIAQQVHPGHVGHAQIGHEHAVADARSRGKEIGRALMHPNGEPGHGQKKRQRLPDRLLVVDNVNDIVIHGHPGPFPR